MYEQLQAWDTIVLVIGCGSRKDAERVSQSLKLPFPVLVDPDRALYRRYGLDKVLIAIQRSGTFLIDKQGILRYIHEATNPQASVDEAELMNEVRKLQTPYVSS
jgi:peroxiredoxin